MPLSDSKIRALVPSDRRYRVADGDGLCVVVEPLSKGGGKSFVGRFRFPPGRQGKQGDYRLGVYGRGFGQITLKAARDEWERVRTWSRESNRLPTEWKLREDTHSSFYIFRTDTQQVLAKGVVGYDNAKERASYLRKRHGLKFDSVCFKKERVATGRSSGASRRNGGQTYR